MDFLELDQELYRLTESENSYLHQKYVDYYKETPTVTLGEEEVFQFSLKQISGIADDSLLLFVRKQSRFAPVPNHVTDVIELNYVYHGSSIQYINGKQVILKEGDLILIDTNSSHAVESADYNDIVISVNVEQKFFKEHFLSHFQSQTSLTQFLFQAISDSQNHNQYLLFRSENSQNLHLLFQQLLCEVYEPRLLNFTYKNLFLQLIMLELIRSFSVEANGTNDNSHRQQLTLDILSHINSNYVTTSLEFCAKLFGYNSSYFSSLVKECTGQTFKNLLQDKRLEASLPFLLHSKQSVRDISMEVGFSNLNHYYKLFKEKYKVTPAEYRKQMKREKSD